MAELGTQLAHVDGGVPNIRVIIPELTEYYLGQLFYFYELALWHLRWYPRGEYFRPAGRGGL